MEDQGSYYTLGGMRVKLLFQAEKNNYLGAPVSVLWSSSAITGVPELAGKNGDFYSEESPSATSLGSNHPEGAALSPSPYLYCPVRTVHMIMSLIFR